MSRTQQELIQDITDISNAMSAIVQGKRVTRLKLGNGAFQREYQYQEITYDSLLAERSALRAELDTLQGIKPSASSFRSSSVPLVVSKFGVLHHGR